MNNDIVTVYLNYKLNVIEKYTSILLKYSLKKPAKLNKTINLILDEYKNYYLVPSNESLPSIFNLRKVEEKDLHDILLAIINCYQKRNISYNSKEMINKVLFLARIINMAINLEKMTRLPIDDVNYMAIINRIIVNPLIIEDKRLELSSELENIVKKEINLERKFWKLQEQDNFNLEINQMSSTQYWINGSYNLKSINRYTPKDIALVSMQKDIKESLLSIYIEQLQILVLKSMLYGYNYTFYMPISVDYFNKKKNINNLNLMIANQQIKSRIVFVLSFDEFNSQSSVSDLISNGFVFALNNLSNDKLYNISSLGNIKIIMAPKTFLRNNRIYLDEWRKTGVRFVDPNRSMIKVELSEILKGDLND